MGDFTNEWTTLMTGGCHHLPQVAYTQMVETVLTFEAFDTSVIPYLQQNVSPAGRPSGRPLNHSVQWFIHWCIHWSIGPLAHRSIGPLAHWSIGTLVHWSIGPLVHWSIGP